MKAQAALDDLQVLVHHDQGELMHVILRTICREVRRICQQIAGNQQAVLFSYQMSFSQNLLRNIQTATRHTIRAVLDNCLLTQSIDIYYTTSAP